MRLLLFGAPLMLCACGALSFDLSQDLPEQKVNGSPLGGLLPAFIPNPIPLDINLQAATEARGTGAASAAFLKSLVLQATPHANPSGNFDFLDEVHILIDARRNTMLPKVEIAKLSPVPKGQTTLDFDIVPGVNILPYINDGSEVSSEATGTAPHSDVTFDGNVTITVKI
jgi:hypothetical protein